MKICLYLCFYSNALFYKHLSFNCCHLCFLFLLVSPSITTLEHKAFKNRNESSVSQPIHTRHTSFCGHQKRFHCFHFKTQSAAKTQPERWRNRPDPSRPEQLLSASVLDQSSTYTHTHTLWIKECRWGFSLKLGEGEIVQVSFLQHQSSGGWMETVSKWKSVFYQPWFIIIYFFHLYFSYFW